MPQAHTLNYTKFMYYYINFQLRKSRNIFKLALSFSMKVSFTRMKLRHFEKTSYRLSVTFAIS